MIRFMLRCPVFPPRHATDPTTYPIMQRKSVNRMLLVVKSSLLQQHCSVSYTEQKMLVAISVLVTVPYSCVFILHTASFPYHRICHNCFLPDWLSGSFCQNIFLFFISLVSFIILFPYQVFHSFHSSLHQGQKPEGCIVRHIEPRRLAFYESEG